MGDFNDAGSSNGRTEAFEAFNRGSNPCPAATYYIVEKLGKSSGRAY